MKFIYGRQNMKSLEAAEGNVEAHGALFTLDTDTGLCTSAEAVVF